MKIELGKTYRDSVSGFEGVATGRYEYLHDCVRYTLTAASKDGAVPVSEVFDEPALEAVKATKHVGARMGGGPREAPKRA